MPQNLRPRSSRFLPLYVFLAAGGLLLVAMLSISVLDEPHSRQYANEAAAVRRLRALTALEKTFAAAHADKGFACEVPLLKAAEKEESGVGHDPPLFLVTGTYAGYKFVLGNCRTDAKGVVAHFEATLSMAGRAFVHSVLMNLLCSGLTGMDLRQTA